jgi:hypothetical protein
MNRTLAIEAVIALGISSWAALKDGQLPWPPTIVMTCLAFGILNTFTFFDERLAVVLGAGFLLAQLVKLYDSGQAYTGGAPKNNKDGTGTWQTVKVGILSFTNGPKKTGQ